MIKIYYILICCILITCNIACNKEDILSPSNVNDNPFIISPDAKDPESVLRRKFYENNGIHLLFNDTLRHEQTGRYADGTPYWHTEIVDIAYSITSYSESPYTFGYIKEQTTQKASVDLVEQYVLPHLGNGLRPYSFFLTTQISYVEEGEVMYLDYYAGLRCFVVNVEEALQMDDAGKKSFSKNIFQDLIKTKINRLEDSKLAAFYTFCSQYYGKRYSNFDIPNNPDLEIMYPLGFLDRGSSYFVSRTTDKANYIDAILNMSEQEFKQQYARYPILLQKYNIMKELINNIGFIF